MALTTRQTEQADTLAVSAQKYRQEIRATDSTDLTTKEKTQVTMLRNLSYPLVATALGHDDYVAEIRTAESTGLPPGIKSKLAAARALAADFVPALRVEPTPPTVISPPVILGVPRVGVSASHTPGSFTGYPAPVITYQWLADDVEISGATSASYTPVSADIGAVLKVTETAANSSGSISSTSSGSPAVIDSSETTGVVFETNWANDTGYYIENAWSHSSTAANSPPSGWMSVQTTATGYWQVVTGGGQDGANVMRCHYDGNFQSANGLYRHLTGERNVGYQDLYFRYVVKWPDNVIFGPREDSEYVPSFLHYWKWMRLHEDGDPTDRSKWHPSITGDVSWFIFNLQGGNVRSFGTIMEGTFNHPPASMHPVPDIIQDKLDNGVKVLPHIVIVPKTSNKPPFTDKQRYCENIGWEMEWDDPDFSKLGRLKTYATGVPQEWHTVELRVKLATDAVTHDGIFEMWLDGVPQTDPTSTYHLYNSPNSPAINGTSIPTFAQKGGWNSFAFMANFGNWFHKWSQGLPDVSPWLEIDSVVVSTEPIGVDYQIGGWAGEPVVGSTLLTPNNLTLVGGWRVPSASISGNTMAYSSGGITKTSDGFWLTHFITQEIAMRFTAPTMGTGSDTSLWPQLTAGQYVSALDDLPEIIGGSELYGLHWDEPNNILWASGRGIYAQETYDGAWLQKIEVTGGGQINHGVSITGEMQAFGGGFVRIPQAWADTHVGGKTMGLAAGGYESGQGSIAGVTLAATDGVTKQDLIKFGYFNADKSLREHRLPDYSIESLSWGVAPEPTYGYWASEDVKGGAAWVDHVNVRGILYFVRQGVGPLNYALQNDVFAVEKKSSLYVYDPDEVAEVAAGTRTSGSLRGEYYDWDSQGIAGIPRGCVYDNGFLYVFYEKSYQSGLETLPVIAVYSVS